jgi:hypothetical protein
MAVALPLLTDLGATPHYSFQCELDGATFTFEFIWNDRDGAWYMQVGDGEENLLVGATRVVLGTLFTARVRNSALFTGQLQAKDTSGQNIDAGIEDLGSRVQIWYFTAAEIAANG